MKKVLLLVVFIVTALSMSAQRGDISLLGNLGYQTDYERFALGAQFRYNLGDNFRLAPDVTFFFPNDKVTGLDVNINLQYVFNLSTDRLSFYPLAGIGMQNNFIGKRTINRVNGTSYETDSETRTKFAVNLGAGLTYNLAARSYLNVEGKFMFADEDNAVFLIGYGYRF